LQLFLGVRAVCPRKGDAFPAKGEAKPSPEERVQSRCLFWDLPSQVPIRVAYGSASPPLLSQTFTGAQPHAWEAVGKDELHPCQL